MRGESAAGAGRVRIALAAAVLLGGLVAALALLGGPGSEAEVEPAPPACVRAWNEDTAATAYGRHNFTFHRYGEALVTFMTSSGELVDDVEAGACAVIFAAQALDPEPFAAGQVLERGVWTPVTSLDGVEVGRVGELQQDAAERPNATLEQTGTLTSR